MAADREARRRLTPQTQNPSSLAPRALRRQTPKVGAVCGKAARTDLCGGTGATRFPTAITEYKGAAVAISPSSGLARAAAAPWRGARPFDGKPGASRLFGGRRRATCPALLTRRVGGLLRLDLLQHGRQPLVVDDRAGLHCLDLVKHRETERRSIELDREPPVRVVHYLDLFAHQ